MVLLLRVIVVPESILMIYFKKKNHTQSAHAQTQMKHTTPNRLHLLKRGAYENYWFEIFIVTEYEV